MSVPVPHPPNFNIDQGYEYYAGKPELLDWINRLLQLNLQRLEQLTSGAVYCQVLDAFHANVVPIRKVNFHAREEYEILPNYKVLQAAFNALGFTKELAVARLSQASSSDLMEFAQWLYKNYRGAAGLPDYNPVARRQLSLKGGTNNIPFPACLNSTYFEFGRSDLRTSGTHWTTPADYVKTAPRTRSSSNTPGTAGRPMSAAGTQTASATKRSMPNLNVGSRFREGLAVPPEHHRRRSPRLSPVSPALIIKVPMRDSESQTDFADEDWRPMTEDDVGTEAVSPKPAPAQAGDSASQHDYGFGYGTAAGAISPSGVSVLSPASSYTAGGAAEDFTFGQHSPGASMGGAGPMAASPRSGLAPVNEPGEGVGEDGEEAEEAASMHALRAAPGSGFGAEEALPQGFGSAAAHSPSAAEATSEAVSHGFGAHDASTQDEQPARSSPGAFGSPRGFGVGDDVAVQAVADVSERGAGEFGVGDDYAVGAGGFGTSAAYVPSPGTATVEQDDAEGADQYADEAVDEEVVDDVARLGTAGGFAGASGVAAAGAAAAELEAEAMGQHGTVRSMEVEGRSGDSGEAEEGGRSSARTAGTAATAAGLAAGMAALDVDHDVATQSEAGATETGEDNGQMGVPELPAAATPGPGAIASRSTPPPAASSLAGLSPEVVKLLASPSMRSRVASAASVRNMGSALDICAAALQAVQRSLDSYNALMAEPYGTPSAVAASGKRSSGPGEEAAAAAATASASANGAASSSGTGPAAAWSPTLCGKVRSLQDALQTLLAHTTLLLGDVQVYSESTKSPESRSNGGGADGPMSPSSAPARDYKAEAATLLEAAREHEARLQGLVQAANEALSRPDEEPTATVATASTTTDKAEGGQVQQQQPHHHHHLTDSQRRLCSTTQLDAHLKAVGMAQFALAQGIHKELALMTMSFFRHNAAMAASESGTPGGAASGTAASRKARVFKLGEFQLKQLRNGDVYKGRYVGNKKNGEGVYHFINADVYEGEFRDDRMDGHGVYTFSHEGRYEGAWRNAVYNGTGAETFAKGSTYRGEYVGGLRNGWGVCRFYNGDYYEGQWVKGLRDGCGMQQCTDDSNFVGEYAKGKRHGHGVYSFPNGDRYEGQYSEDLPHGFGTYHFASGQCYQGQWQAGKKHGWSVYTVDNGSRFMGLWSEGKPTWVQPLAGDKAAGTADGTDAGASELPDEDAKQLRQALEARDKAAQAADLARTRAAGHWDQSGSVQSHVLSALSRAHNSASAAQQARRKACDLASRLDAAVALIQQQQQQGAAATPAGTPGP
ncbi:hypothetical protein HYH02_005348 [Chlamydomonas schloesseri]|uniref:Calponin-homology (CH) domain-containing protein n=1 Tax=Chlamydomonas schloesseri TaxID=2026947 RepID=A0A836B7I7_9CHLO|nr:hypothetical protein HYH02_005348 [Chlamydomonas schloesseri]|eukprot:KAG2449825.1 hypothetical protein HYH02_005348 [Chlamydomonas schloesseri]